MRHQGQKFFCSIFVGITHPQKGYLVYLTSTKKIISSYDVDFDESFSIMLAYTSQPYVGVMVMHPDVSYTPYSTSSK